MTKQKHFYLVRGLIREQGHWGEFTELLKRAFPEVKVTPLEIPGAGIYCKEESPLSIAGMVEQMRRDYLKVRNPEEEDHLIAISLGGMIALQWLSTYKDDFKTASFINTSFGGISPMFQRLLPSAFVHLLKVPLLKGREKESRILELVSNHQDVFHETLNRWEVICKERPVTTKNTFRQLFAGAKFKAPDYIPGIPVLLLASTQDRMVSVECSRSISKKWQAPLMEHPTAGHDLTVDDPAWVVSEVEKFLSGRR